MSGTKQKIELRTRDDPGGLQPEAEQALGRTVGEAGERFDELCRRLHSAISDGKHALERMRADAIRRVRQADQLVRDNPYYAIGVAAGVGAVAGLLVVARRCDSSHWKLET